MATLLFPSSGCNRQACLIMVEPDLWTENAGLANGPDGGPPIPKHQLAHGLVNRAILHKGSYGRLSTRAGEEILCSKLLDMIRTNGAHLKLRAKMLQFLW
ncbi:hypothetical protein PCANC_17778 [Puccinia coronata f. sp. avenae]|uniref:Uncharacterized protein n=1 Tax=Puccinia coronata f. sp. avenae TaxID=200324 RepID=A0A2N5SJ84_9BASI|nr:hypothetical protein PCANC_17778 [Puccinia coronata f. sp. avenae]